jgi:small-conductance mechanosensitive channel
MQEYGPMILSWLKTSGVRVIFIMLVAFISIRILFLLINRIKALADDGNDSFTSEREKRAATLVLVLKQISSIGISGIAFMMVLREFRIDIAPIIAGAGIVGLAIGFGAQSLVKDVISGFFILMENQYDVGDVISGAGVSGAVERINLRFTQLRDLQGRVHFIPNGEFRVVSNLTRGWSRAVVDVGVSYDEDIDYVQEVMVQVAAALKADPVFGVSMIEPMEILGIESFGESSVNIRLLFKSLPGRQWVVAREFRKRLKRRFAELGIQIPFPHRVLITAPGPDASARPAREGATQSLAPRGPKPQEVPASTAPVGSDEASRLPDTHNV